MYVEFLPKKVVDIAKESELNSKEKRRKIIEYFSEIIKLIVDEAVQESLRYSGSKLIKGLNSRYFQKKAEELEIIKSTNRGYIITEKARVLWDNYLKEIVNKIINLRGEEATAVFNSSLSLKTLLSLASEAKTFNELRKELDVHEGSLSKVYFYNNFRPFN